MGTNMRMALFLAISAAGIGIGVATAPPANAFFDRLNWDTIESTAYAVEASGRNFRVYEWTSQLDPKKTCTAVFAEAGGPVGHHCTTSKWNR